MDKTDNVETTEIHLNHFHQHLQEYSNEAWGVRFIFMQCARTLLRALYWLELNLDADVEI